MIGPTPATPHFVFVDSAEVKVPSVFFFFFLLLVFSTGHSLLLPPWPEMDYNHYLLPVLHPLPLTVSSSSICLPAVLLCIQWECLTTLPSPLCSYFIHAETVSSAVCGEALSKILCKGATRLQRTIFLERPNLCLYLHSYFFFNALSDEPCKSTCRCWKSFNIEFFHDDAVLLKCWSLSSWIKS